MAMKAKNMLESPQQVAELFKHKSNPLENWLYKYGPVTAVVLERRRRQRSSDVKLGNKTSLKTRRKISAALKANITPEVLAKRKARMGYAQQFHPYKMHLTRSKELDLVEVLKAGVTFDSIKKRFNVSHSRIREIIDKYGIDRPKARTWAKNR
jgi:hypothetical protein